MYAMYRTAYINEIIKLLYKGVKINVPMPFY